MLHKLFKPILLILLLSFAATATTWSQNLQQQPRDQNNNDNDDYYDRVKIDRYLDVEIWSDHTDGEYYEGDRVSLFYRVNRDAFVVIYSVDSRGRVNILFPVHPKQDNFVAGGVTHRLPDGDDDYDLVISGPEGVENIQIIASRERFTIPDWYPNSGLIAETDDIHDYMDWLNMRYFVKYEGQRFAYDRTALYINEWEEYYFRPVYYPYYPSWTVSGNVYFDYWHGSSIYIDGVYWGCAPLYIPRIYVGWHTFTVYDHYGHCWEYDYHVSRYNTVVLDYTIINTSSHVRSKYKEVRQAGYRAPAKAGYLNYDKKVKAIKTAGVWKTKAVKQTDSKTTVSKKSQFIYTGEKKFLRGGSTKMDRVDTKTRKSKYDSYGKEYRGSKSTTDKSGSTYKGYDKKSTSGSSGYKKRSSTYDKKSSTTGARKSSMKSGGKSGKYRPSARGSSKAGSSKSGNVKKAPSKSSSKKSEPAQKSIEKKSSGSKKSGGSSSKVKDSKPKASGSKNKSGDGKKSSLKRILTYLIALVFSLSLAAPSMAVEKKEKKKAKKTTIQKKSDSKKKVVAKSQKKSSKKLKSGSKKKYDSFVDRNKNGIDDRAEKKKLKKKPAKKPASKKKKKTKKKKGSK
jgi:hypothetical protein